MLLCFNVLEKNGIVFSPILFIVLINFISSFPKPKGHTNFTIYTQSNKYHHFLKKKNKYYH